MSNFICNLKCYCGKTHSDDTKLGFYKFISYYCKQAYLDNNDNDAIHQVSYEIFCSKQCVLCLQYESCGLDWDVEFIIGEPWMDLDDSDRRKSI